MTKPIVDLLNALGKVQDWSTTRVGDAMDAVEELLPKLDALAADRDGDRQVALSFDGIASRAVAENSTLMERVVTLERENAELRTLFQRATEYLDVLGDEEDGDGIHNFTERLRNDFEHRVTKPPGPR